MSTIIETHKTYQPRLVLFYFVIGALLLVLAAGLGYRQLLRGGVYSEREKLQNQRRLLVPGPRGNIYDREGRLLVGNRPRFSVVLHIAELREEFRREYIKIVRAYRESEMEGDLDRSDRPRPEQLDRIARATVVERYLGEVRKILGREVRLDSGDLDRHFAQQLLLPYTLIDELEPEEYARLLERLPVRSPLQVYVSSTRSYPWGSTAAHTLGYVVANDDLAAEESPGDDLRTFALKGTLGKDGLERQHDLTLQGGAGGAIYRVDPAGFRIEPALERHPPVQGGSLVTSLDLDLQRAAEESMVAMGNLKGAAVALDVRTGEVLLMASKPDFDLNDTAPHISQAFVDKLNTDGGWTNRALNGLYPPGSTFKLITSLAGLRHGTITPASRFVCPGGLQVGSRWFPCNVHSGHGDLDFRHALAKSCNVFFYHYGIDTGAENLAAEARRFHLDQPTGIDLPGETRHMLVADAAWKRGDRNEAWFPGDTANMAIGQGFLSVTPLQMACFVASFARGETRTVPTLVHQPGRPRQHTPGIDLDPALRQAIIDGMELVVQEGSGRLARIPGVRVAGKTGTAQVRTPQGTIDIAWFIAFAPADDPEIAIAVVREGDEPDEATAGGRFAAPVGKAILQTYFDKKQHLQPKSFAAGEP